VLDQCGASTQDFVYKTASALDEDLVGKVAAAGVEVNEADKQAFIDASGKIYEEFGSTVDGGQDLVDGIQSLAAGS
jgi:TRAP-type C4-dicarboxylate transport system substrate-binding protein